MTVLPYLLLASTLAVRYAITRRWGGGRCWGWLLNLVIVQVWIALDIWRDLWPFIIIPFVFLFLHGQALRRWRR